MTVPSRRKGGARRRRGSAMSTQRNPTDVDEERPEPPSGECCLGSENGLRRHYENSGE